MKKTLQSLIEGARKAVEPARNESASAPLGFATRVAARWVAGPRSIRGVDLLERLGWWAAAMSVAICLTAFAHRNTVAQRNPLDALIGEPLPEAEF